MQKNGPRCSEWCDAKGLVYAVTCFCRRPAKLWRCSLFRVCIWQILAGNVVHVCELAAADDVTVPALVWTENLAHVN